MGEINLFQVDDGDAVAEVLPESVDLEREVQRLIENNLQELLGIRFLSSEYSTGEKHGGRIDTLGLDENDSPVIIEYKKNKNQNVINQGLYYFDWLVDHKAEFEDLARTEVDEDTEVDWSSPRLVCIAPDFTKYDSHAVEQIDQNIELLRFRRYSDGLLLFELINAVESTTSTGESDGDYKGVADYRAQAGEELIQLFEDLDDYLLSLGDDVQKKELKYYYAYKRIQNFACVEFRPQSDALLIYLKLNPKELEQSPDIARDVTEVGHYGTGDFELKVTDEQELELSKEYIDMSYEGV